MESFVLGSDFLKAVETQLLKRHVFHTLRFFAPVAGLLLQI